MNSRWGWGILFILGLVLSALAAERPRTAPCPPQKFFLNLVRQDPEVKKGSVNTFSKTDRGDFWFWHERRMLLNPGLPVDALTCKTPHMVINRRLTLEDGILPPGQDPHGSTYLETHEWARDAIYTAVMKGETVRVTKK